MRALMGLIKDRHGTYYARHKVPERLQAAVAVILDNGKAKQMWLKKSLGTKVVSEANVRAKPVQMEFDRIIAEAEAQLKSRPLRTSLSDIEIKRIAEFFYAHELQVDEELRVDGRGSDPTYASVHKQLTEAEIEFTSRYDPATLTMEPGRGLSPRMMEQISEDTAAALALNEDALARGDIKHIRYEVDELLKVFQINLDPSCDDYRKLARAVLTAFVKQLRAVLARQKGEPVDTPPLIVPSEITAAPGGTLSEALVGWQKERAPSSGVMAEYQRALRLFSELHGNLPIVQIKRPHARKFREELQDIPRHCPGELMRLPLPALAEWGRAHPEAKKISPHTVNKLFGGVQTLALWAYRNGAIPEDVPWSDPFANMRLRAPASNRDVFTVDDINTLFASPIFTKMERPQAGRGEAAFWLPLLGLYSGARRSELTQLTVADVTKVADVVCFRFVEDTARGKRLKTETSARTVPVHPELIKLGWLHYVDGVKRKSGANIWLFPAVSPEAPGAIKAWTKWFHRYLNSIGLTDSRKVFHSFRHTFKDALRAANVTEDLNDALCGQRNNSVGRGYGAKQASGAADIVRRFGMSRIKEAIDAVNYKGLRLSQVNSGVTKGRKR